MRMSIKEAKELGIFQKLPEQVKKEIAVAQKRKPTNINPQQTLWEAVKQVIPEAVAEQEGLIEGRKFRADIYLPSSKIVVEVDGFLDHYRVKKNMQATLDRQNLFVAHGYKVLRYYSARILKNLPDVVREIESLHNASLKIPC